MRLASVAKAWLRGVAFTDPGAHFDQFMVGQGAIQFRDHRVGQPGVAEHDDGVHGMRKPPEVFLLFLRECHGGIIVPNGH